MKQKKEDLHQPWPITKSTPARCSRGKESHILTAMSACCRAPRFWPQTVNRTLKRSRPWFRPRESQCRSSWSAIQSSCITYKEKMPTLGGLATTRVITEAMTTSIQFLKGIIKPSYTSKINITRGKLTPASAVNENEIHASFQTAF